MNTKRRLSRLLIATVLFGIAAFEAFWIAQNRREIARLKSLSADRSGKTHELAPSARSNVSALPAADPLSPPASPKGSGVRSWGDNFRERVIRTEAFQANMLAVMDGHLSRRYAELFRRIPLDRARENQLRALLAQALFSPELIPSADTRKQATVQEAQAYYDHTEQKILRLLGAHNYERYRGYMEELPALNTRDDIAATLASSGIPLNPQAYAMLQANLKSMPPQSRTVPFISVDAVRTAMTGSERTPLTENFLNAAKDWLTPAQHRALSIMHKQERTIRHAQTLKDSLTLPLELPGPDILR